MKANKTEIEEAIELCDEIKNMLGAVVMTAQSYNETLNDVDKIIELLKRGEKFEKMWEEFYNVWGEYPIELHSIDEFMDDIKQKYFPEEVNK